VALMAVAYIKLSWCCVGDRRPAVIVVKEVGTGPKRGAVVVVVVVVIALEA
jgi:hypothetical protein